MTRRLRLGALATGLSLLLLLLLAPMASAAPAQSAAKHAGSLTAPVTGTLANGGSFAGTLNITHFVNQGGRLIATGTVSGTLTNAAGAVIGSVSNVPVSAPVAAAAGSCTILDLTLGPLHLNLLGLVVDLNQVRLVITAQQGAGNLLGNLPCAVAGILDSGGPLGSIAGLLNNISRRL